MESSQDPHVLLEQAETMLAAGKIEDAEALYRALIEGFPGLIEAYRGLGRVQNALGRSIEAAATLGELGEGLLGAGRYETAAEVLREAVAWNPEQPKWRFGLARALMLGQRFGDAVHQLERLVQGGSADGSVQVYFALALWESGQIERAEEVLRAVAGKSGSEAAGAGLQLGRLLLWKGEFDEAILFLQAPPSPSLTAGLPAADRQLDLARALEGAGRDEAALAAYDRVLALAPQRYPPRYSRARVLARLGRPDEARAEMKRYQDLYQRAQEDLRREGRARAQVDRGWELMAQEQPEQALQLFENFPFFPDALVGAATARSVLGDHEGAVNALEQAVTLAPERQDLRLMLLEQRTHPR